MTDFATDPFGIKLMNCNKKKPEPKKPQPKKPQPKKPEPPATVYYQCQNPHAQLINPYPAQMMHQPQTMFYQQVQQVQHAQQVQHVQHIQHVQQFQQVQPVYPLVTAYVPAISARPPPPPAAPAKPKPHVCVNCNAKKMCKACVKAAQAKKKYGYNPTFNNPRTPGR